MLSTQHFEPRDSRKHHVLLYGSDEVLLARSVGRYLKEGLDEGDCLLVVATDAHRPLFVAELEGLAEDTKSLLQSGRLTFLDAQLILARFMLNGQPDRLLFESTVGHAARELIAKSATARICAFGEMVGLLWSSRQFTAASRLEHLWNDLISANDIELFCAYPIDVFSSEFEMGRVDTILCSHTTLIPTGRTDALRNAVRQGMDKVLGPRAAELAPLMKANYRPSWATLPEAEATILWLRNNLPGSVEEILSAAREYFHLSEAQRPQSAQFLSR